MEELIAKRYVNALSEVTTKEGREEYGEILNGLATLFDDKNVAEKLNSPLVSSTDKINFILDGIEDCDSNFKNFIRILGEKGRLALIPTIAKILNRELQRERDEYEGTVIAGKQLSDEELADLEESLKKYTGGSTIKLRQTLSDYDDGIKVTVEDLGIEVNFSKQRVKEQLIDFITKSL